MKTTFILGEQRKIKLAFTCVNVVIQVMSLASKTNGERVIKTRIRLHSMVSSESIG